LQTLLAKASPLRSGDQLAGIAAETGEERVAAQYALADLPLRTFLDEHVVPYATDEVTRLIVDTQDRAAFSAIAHLTVGGFPRLAALGYDDDRGAHGARARRHARDWRAAVSRSAACRISWSWRRSAPGRHPLPQHDWSARLLVGAAAAQPPD